MNNRSALRECPYCGTWTCSACGWKRRRANLRGPGRLAQDCARCGGTEGPMVPTRHGSRQFWICTDGEEVTADEQEGPGSTLHC